MEDAYARILKSTCIINFRTLSEYLGSHYEEVDITVGWIHHTIRTLKANKREKIAGKRRNRKKKGTCSKESVWETIINDEEFSQNTYRRMAINLMAMLQFKPNCIYKSPSYVKMEEDNITVGEELLFIFAIYHPFVYKCNYRLQNIMKRTHSVIMLGSNTLNMLCDKIICNEMYQEVNNELSDTPEIQRGSRMGDVFKSRMLYIGNTFYIDDANKFCEDYSSVVKQWAESYEDIKLGATLSMYNNTCLDLIARINYPYVFQHLGNCQHIVKIECIRLISKHDSLQRSSYPLRSDVLKHLATSCFLCNKTATWVVTGSDRIPLSAIYMCSRCFSEYNYLENGQKIGKFNAVRINPLPIPYDEFSNRVKFEIDYE